MKTVSLWIFALSLLASPLAASEGWLPDRVSEGLARQLAGRMIEAGLAGSDEGRAISEAQTVVAAMRRELDGWGVRGVVEKAPRFPELEIPGSGNEYLDAMTRYTLCNLVLLRDFLDPASREDRDAMITSVLGLTGMTMAIVRLREPFVGEGGTDAAIEAALTRPELEPLLETVQNDAGLLDHVARQCSPVVRTLARPGGE